jgi:hypothetical protein
MLSRIIWTFVGIACAAWIELALVPRSQNPGFLHLIAALVILGGIARGAKGSQPKGPRPRLTACPNCGFSVYDLGMLASAYVCKCKKCDQVFCPFCGKHSFWRGSQCPKCDSRSVEVIGRIKKQNDMPTFWEDTEDGKFP